MASVSEDAKWWEQGKRDRHHLVTELVKDVQNRNAYRRTLNLHHLRLYADRNVSGLTAGTYAKATMGEGFRRPRLSLNVVRNCIDTTTSMITRSRPAIAYKSDGDFYMQQRAKTRAKFVMGLFQAGGVYSLGPRMFKDAGIFGTGFIKVCRDYANGRVTFEKTFPGEIWVDDAEAIYGDPRTLYQVRAVDKGVLRNLYPKRESAIAEARAPDIGNYGRSHCDQAIVVEAWHLPSGPGAKDGWTGCYTDKGALYETSYKHEAFPFARMPYTEETLGYWGNGIAYNLTGIQYEINSIVRMLQMGLYSAGGMTILLEKGSKVARTQLNNDIWARLVYYSGAKPDYVTPEPLSVGAREMLQFYIEQAYAIEGISQLGARGEIPAGLAGSGRAQLVYKDIESQRFITVQRQYEQAHMDLAERALEGVADIYDKTGEYEVRYQNKSFMERIGIDDIGDDGDEFAVQAEAISMLPYTLAGRQALAQQAEASGYIDKVSAAKIAGWGDYNSEMNLHLAPTEIIDERIDKIMRTGEYIGPHPRMDIELAITRANLWFLKYECDGAPPERLELLGDFIDELHDMAAAGEAALAAEGNAAAPPGAGLEPAAEDIGLEAGAPPTISAMEAA